MQPRASIHLGEVIVGGGAETDRRNIREIG